MESLQKYSLKYFYCNVIQVHHGSKICYNNVFSLKMLYLGPYLSYLHIMLKKLIFEVYHVNKC